MNRARSTSRARAGSGSSSRARSWPPPRSRSSSRTAGRCSSGRRGSARTARTSSCSSSARWSSTPSGRAPGTRSTGATRASRASGRFLRRTSIDELPQLWNVVRGDMSVIGPRPTLRYQVERYTERQRRRLEVRPGLTGWAQIHGRATLPWAERIELDVWYVEHRSPARRPEDPAAHAARALRRHVQGRDGGLARGGMTERRAARLGRRRGARRRPRPARRRVGVVARPRRPHRARAHAPLPRAREGPRGRGDDATTPSRRRRAAARSRTVVEGGLVTISVATERGRGGAAAAGVRRAGDPGTRLDVHGRYVALWLRDAVPDPAAGDVRLRVLSRRSRRYRVAVGAVLAAEAALLAWNAWRYDWLRGYDAFANDRYAEVVSTEYRLPSEAESGVWHTPPLWFALAGALRRLRRRDRLGARRSARASSSPPRPGSRSASWSSCSRGSSGPSGECCTSSRSCSPPPRRRSSARRRCTTPRPSRSRWRPGVSSSRCARLRTRWTLWSAAAAGALLGLACPDPCLGAAGARRSARRGGPGRMGHGRRWAPARRSLATSVALLAPWLVNQEVAHGSALAFNRPAPPGSMLDAAARELLPRPAGAAGARAPRHAALPERARPAPLRGLVGRLGADLGQPAASRSRRRCCRRAWSPSARGRCSSASCRRSSRSPGCSRSACSPTRGGPLRSRCCRSRAVGVATAYVAFAVRYPSTDGDTIKGTYLLMALPAACLGAAFVVDALRPRGRGWAIVAAARARRAGRGPAAVPDPLTPRPAATLRRRDDRRPLHLRRPARRHRERVRARRARRPSPPTSTRSRRRCTTPTTRRSSRASTTPGTSRRLAELVAEHDVRLVVPLTDLDQEIVSAARDALAPALVLAPTPGGVPHDGRQVPRARVLRGARDPEPAHVAARATCPADARYPAAREGARGLRLAPHLPRRRPRAARVPPPPHAGRLDGAGASASARSSRSTSSATSTGAASTRSRAR